MRGNILKPLIRLMAMLVALPAVILMASPVIMLMASPAMALERPDVTFKVFQFPANMIPRVDGDTSDWAMVPDDYVIDETQLRNVRGEQPDPKSLKVKVKVGWVKGLNRLYFLYEATDDYWDFDQPGLKNDIFEIAVDGDRSGGPFIARFHPELAPKPAKDAAQPATPPTPPSFGYISPEDAWLHFQGIHAQNYHIFTPAGDKDWAMAWGPQASWIKQLPWSNIAYSYGFKSGQGGRLIMEFWITPFDYASPEGPDRSIESKLTEDKIMGLSWAIIDSDGPKGARGFWNLSSQHTMYGQASYLTAFRLMPLEARYRKPIEARWSFKVIDTSRRVVAFTDESSGKIASRVWDFGDGETSTEAFPIHTYTKPAQYVVTLTVTGPDGTARLSKVWDVSFMDAPK